MKNIPSKIAIIMPVSFTQLEAQFGDQLKAFKDLKLSDLGNKFLGAAMKPLSDYTDTEKNTFETMRNVLEEYNRKIALGEHVDPPGYSDDEMMAFSRYCELLMAEELRQFKKNR